MSRNVSVVIMSLKQYYKKYGMDYKNGDLTDYPLEELDYIIQDTDIEKVALIGNRLFEIE